MTTGTRVRGAIPAEGALALLRSFEVDRASGRLHYEGGDVSGEVWLVGGSPLDDEAQLEAMERLLQLEVGEYRFTPALPPLPMSRGDDRTREGRLGVHAVADLMSYCEECSLTGSLSVRRREREARLGYVRGELVDIRVDGKERDDLFAVFEWEAGEFRIELAEAEAAAGEDWSIRAEELRPESAAPPSVEVSLEQIVEEGRTRRPSTLPPPKVGAGERKTRPDATVRIVYLGAPDPIAPPSSTTEAVEPPRPLLSAAERFIDEEPEGALASALSTLGWVALWAAFILGALAMIPHILPDA